ncbi:hypothetical protein E3J61_03060 [Candidatus Dependentiae bacterium]|nr:MAG: hypothetical protein E3J61_03060 [Candidatus Dependentiae bacterium]
MKKEIVFSAALLLSGAMYAEQEVSLDDIKKEANTIVFTMTITRDAACDEEVWAKAIDITAEVAQRGDSSSSDEMVDATLQAMKETYQLAGENGIHGSLNIGIGDGAELTKGCDGICGGDDPKDR